MKFKILPLLVTLFILGCSNDEIEEQIQKFTIEITSSNGGSVSSAGGSFIEGSSFSVTANPNNGFSFVQWSNGSTSNPLELTVNSNQTIQVIFEENTVTSSLCSTEDYNLNIGTLGNGVVYSVTGELTNGQHIYNTEYIEYTNRCFSEGEDIFLWAKPGDEYQFYGWRLPDGRIYDMNGGRIFTDTELKSFYNTYGDDVIHLTPIFVEHHFWEDPLYSSLNMDSSPEEIVRVFLEESSQYGWDFKDKVEEIIITNGQGSYSKASCQENTYIDINIPIHDGPDSFTRWDFSQRMTVIYHELGHDLLNLNHICLPAHHMSGWDSCPLISGGNGSRDTSDMYHNGVELSGAAFLLMETDDDVLSFKRATEDLFELNGQDVKCDIE